MAPSTWPVVNRTTAPWGTTCYDKTVPLRPYGAPLRQKQTVRSLFWRQSLGDGTAKHWLWVHHFLRNSSSSTYENVRLKGPSSPPPHTHKRTLIWRRISSRFSAPCIVVTLPIKIENSLHSPTCVPGFFHANSCII